MAVPGALTDPSLVEAAELTYASAGRTITAYRVSSAAVATTRPGLIVVHEAMGLNDHIRDLARRFAAAGFDVIAPELYSARGGPDPADVTSIMAAMLSLPDAEAVEDLRAAAAVLSSLPSANGRIGCIGFCSGGRHTLLLACATTVLDAAVDCWGGFIDRASPDELTSAARPKAVIDLVSDLSCPVYAAGGTEDTNPAPALLAKLQRRADAAGKDVEVHLYPEAGHAFLADYRSTYREAQAHLLWAEVLAFLHRRLDG